MPASTAPLCCEHLLARFPSPIRPTLPLLDYLHLRMVEGVLAMSMEDYDRAAAHFLLVQSFEDEIDDRELLAIANFWIGRCRRKTGPVRGGAALHGARRDSRAGAGLLADGRHHAGHPQLAGFSKRQAGRCARDPAARPKRLSIAPTTF